ncbi:MAG: sn-glycerol-3-phosphate ABC transporter ATP-binding protein UgpC [Verrucomicrobiia bacterium]
MKRQCWFDPVERLCYKAFTVAKVLLENVSKTYPGGVKAVDNANLEIGDQEFVVLVGPSGCGKSTTLRMVAGLEEISSGNIFIDGKLVNDVPPKDRDIAMVFQNYALYPHMTVYKNMAFGLMLRKYPKAEINQRVRDAAQILGITDEQLQRKPKSLSGGQRQRVAVGRAIVRKPKVFLFDEPLSNLDAKMRVQMRAEISKLHDRLKSTMIYVTHDQVEAMTMGDRIVVMNNGVIQQVDEPLALYDNPKNMFVAGFIGSPPMNFFKGTIVQRQDGLWFVEQTAGGHGEKGFSTRIDDEMAKQLAGHAGKAVVFGSRPEDINDKRHASFAKPDQTASATVEVVEPMGAEVYLYLNSGSHNFVARVNPHEKADVGQTLDMAFDMRKCHFFDSQTERVIV